MVKMMNELLSETDKIIQAAANGELDKRADANLFVGGWNKLVAGVNDTITNIVDPLMVTADYVEKVSKGVIPPDHHDRVQRPVQHHQEQPERHGQDDERAV